MREFLRLLWDSRFTHIARIDDSNPTYVHVPVYCPDGYLETSTPYVVRRNDHAPVITMESSVIPCEALSAQSNRKTPPKGGVLRTRQRAKR